MKERLPVYLEKKELPPKNDYEKEYKKSYGYVSFLNLLAVTITIASLLTVIIIGK